MRALKKALTARRPFQAFIEKWKSNSDARSDDPQNNRVEEAKGVPEYCHRRTKSATNCHVPQKARRKAKCQTSKLDGDSPVPVAIAAKNSDKNKQVERLHCTKQLVTLLLLARMPPSPRKGHGVAGGLAYTALTNIVTRWEREENVIVATIIAIIVVSVDNSK